MSQTASRRRKVLAILAAGAVVGVGGAYTLAAWNDSEFLTADFVSGSFNLEGSTDGATYSEHATADAAAEVFTLTTDNMVPDQVVYDSFFVRLDDTTTVSGTLAQPAAATATGAIADYAYEIAAIDAAATCDEAALAAGTLLGSAGTLDGANTATATADLVAGADDAAGTAVQLCIQVTASPDLAQGQTATATWEFVATSNDAS